MTELKATNLETARYKDHLKDDLKFLLLEKGKTDPAFTFVIEKKIKHFMDELETLEKSNLLEAEEELDCDDQDSIYNSSCDAYSLDES